jgi:hypothetical protein
MTSQVASAGERWRTFKPTLLWAVVTLAAILLLYLVAGRVERMVARWPQSGQSAISPTHCTEFSALAKTTYGVQWKSRLDPSDTTCANEIQQAWEQQRISRDAEAERALEMSRTIEPAITQPPPPPVLTSQPAAARADTYCLNVISLAKAKFGADWASKIDPADQAACVRP